MPRLLVGVATLIVYLFAAACVLGPRTPVTDIDHAGERPPRLQFVFAERVEGTTTIWAARPDEPADRRVLARIPHDPNWGIRAALSPDGRLLAYTFMPPGGRDPDRDAALALLDVQGRHSRRLATGVDLRTTPLWTGPAAVIVQRATDQGQGVLVRLALDGDEQPLATALPGHRLFPAATGSDGAAIYVIDLSADGAVLRRLDSAGDHTVARVGDGPARGFALAPAGGSLALLRLEPGVDGRRYRAVVVDLDSGVIRAVRPDRDRVEDTGLAWDGRGRLWVTALARPGGPGLLLGVVGTDDRTTATGFDALVTAAPDGNWLAVRAFAGDDSDRPGTEAVHLLHADGRRVPVTAAGGVMAVGWRSG